MNDFFTTIIKFIVDNLISLIALIISLFNVIYYLINNKKKIELSINCYTTGEVDNNTFYMFDVSFINKSSLSISINGIKIIDNQQEYLIINSPRKLFEKQSKVGHIITDLKKIFSVSFPINLQGYLSTHNFIIMYGPDKFVDNKQKVVIYTSRGKIVKKINISEKYISTKEFMDQEKHYSE